MELAMKQKLLILVISFLIIFIDVYSQKKVGTLNCPVSLNALATNRDEASCNFSYNQYGELLSILFISTNTNDNDRRSKYTYTYDVGNKKIYEVNENWKNNQWVPRDKTVYDLDDNKNITQLTLKWYVDNKFIDKYIHYYTYDEFQNINTITIKRLIGNQMENDNYEYYGYDDNNNLVYYLYRVWFGKWYDQRKIYHYYNDNNIITKSVIFSYSIDENIEDFEYVKIENLYSPTGKPLTSISVIKTKNAVLNYKKSEYKYDDNDNLILSIYSKSIENEWKIQSQTENAYDINNNIITSVYKKNIDGVLTLVSKNSYAYDSHNNLIMDMYSRWENNSWHDNSLITYSYDNNNNMLVKISQMWSENKWKNLNRLTYEYNNNNNMTKAYSEIWYDDGMNEKKWVPMDIGFKINIHNEILAKFNEKRGIPANFSINVNGYVVNLQYQDITSNEELILLDNHLSLSPNPATDYIEIATEGVILNGTQWSEESIEGHRSKSIQIYDFLGNVVLTFTPALSLKGERVRIDVSGLAKGVYFVRIGGKIYKFVKL